jgi:hypothetical protein
MTEGQLCEHSPPAASDFALGEDRTRNRAAQSIWSTSPREKSYVAAFQGETPPLLSLAKSAINRFNRFVR